MPTNSNHSAITEYKNSSPMFCKYVTAFMRDGIFFIIIFFSWKSYFNNSFVRLEKNRSDTRRKKPIDNLTEKSAKQQKRKNHLFKISISYAKYVRRLLLRLAFVVFKEIRCASECIECSTMLSMCNFHLMHAGEMLQMDVEVWWNDDCLGLPVLALTYDKYEFISLAHIYSLCATILQAVFFFIC